METVEILEHLDDVAQGHPHGDVAQIAMYAAIRIRELRDQLMERTIDQDNMPTYPASKFKLGDVLSSNQAFSKMKVLGVTFEIDGSVSYVLSTWSVPEHMFKRHIVSEHEFYDWVVVADA